VFLDINGWLVADLEERLFDAMIAISTRTLDKRGLADLLRLLATENRLSHARERLVLATPFVCARIVQEFGRDKS